MIKNGRWSEPRVVTVFQVAERAMERLAREMELSGRKAVDLRESRLAVGI